MTDSTPKGKVVQENPQPKNWSIKSLWLAYFFCANLEGSRIIKQYKMHSTGVFTTTFKNANRNTWKANHMSPPSKHRSDPFFLAGLCGSLSQVFVTNKDSTFRDGFGSAAPLFGTDRCFFCSLREPNFNQQQRESCAKAMFFLFLSLRWFYCNFHIM